MPPRRVCPWLSSERPLVFGHRGARGLAPENTLAAFDRGVAEGVDGLELDLRLSRDGVPVVIHDDDLGRTTDATGPVTALTADQLARVDAGFRFARGQDYPWRGKGLGVPSLREVLARYPAMPLIVEMKTNSVALALATVREILAAGAAERVCLGSFGHRALSAARRAAPQLATSASETEVAWALFRSKVRHPLAGARYQAYIVPERRRSLTIISPRFVHDAADCGCTVHVWTVNLPADVERLLRWGVRGILTDRPDVTVPVVRSHQNGVGHAKRGQTPFH
jgi:glycerophosphoryl diester phosphodiesterase